MLLFLCVHWACVISTHGGVCVFLSGDDSWPCLPPVTKRLWLLECDQPLARFTPPSSTPAAWPALLLCLWPSLSLDPHCIWVWSAMKTCSAQLEAAASWASHPFFHPSFLAQPRPSLFPSCSFTLQHPTIRASLMAIIMPSWWAHCPWRVDGSSDLWHVSCLQTMHAHPCYCIYTYQGRQMHAVTKGPQSPTPDAVFCLWPHQLVWTKWQQWKQCFIEFIAQWLDWMLVLLISHPLKTHSGFIEVECGWRI